MYFFLNSINHLTKPICFLNIFNIYSVVHFEMHQKESKESFLHNDKTYQRFFVPLQRNSISNTQHTTFRRFIIFSEIFSLFKIFHITFVLVCLIMFCVKCCMLWSFNKTRLYAQRERIVFIQGHIECYSLSTGQAATMSQCH